MTPPSRADPALLRDMLAKAQAMPLLRPLASGAATDKPWRKWGAYRTDAEAQQTMDRVARKYSFYEFRLLPPSP